MTSTTSRGPTHRQLMPRPLAVPASVGALFLLMPLVALLVRAPWSGLPRILSDAGVLTALRLSLECATAATGVSIVLGVPLAWALAPVRGRGISALRALVTLPLVLPPVVGGFALLLALGRRGLVGQYLDQWFGVTLPFTTAGVIVAATFVAGPSLITPVEGRSPRAARGPEEAAAPLGASRLTVFRRVPLPMVTPSLVA